MIRDRKNATVYRYRKERPNTIVQTAGFESLNAYDAPTWQATQFEVNDTVAVTRFRIEAMGREFELHLGVDSGLEIIKYARTRVFFEMVCGPIHQKVKCYQAIKKAKTTRCFFLILFA